MGGNGRSKLECFAVSRQEMVEERIRVKRIEVPRRLWIPGRVQRLSQVFLTSNRGCKRKKISKMTPGQMKGWNWH